MTRLLFGTARLLLTVAAVSCRAAEIPEDLGLTLAHVQTQDAAGGVRSLLAPGTRVPKIGPDGSVLDYVRWAKSALDRGQDAEAELSLEWGQVRRRVDEEENALALGKAAPTYDAQCLRSLCKAMQSIGSGHAAAGREYLRAALAEFTQEDRPRADYADPMDGAPASTMDTAVRKRTMDVTQLTATKP